jgi:Xaa-Pro dipeptidase
MSNRREFLQGLAAVGVTTHISKIGNVRHLRFAAAIPPGQNLDGLPPEWYRRKIVEVQERMRERKLDAIVLLSAVNVIYTTGYFHLPTERPLAVLIPKTGEPTLFIPELESDQVKLWWVKDYESYFDFPGPVNRVQWIFERIAKRGLGNGRIGIEEASPSRLKRIQAGVPHAMLVNDGGEIIETMRWIKDESEISVQRRAVEYADYTVKAAREFIERNGSVTENEILKASANAVADKMARELKDVVGVEISPPFGGLVPFGKRSAFPHAVPSRDRLQRGDALILSYGATVGGYNTESERAFCVGKPTDYAKRLYDAMLAAHDTGAANLKDGAIAEEVDRTSLDQIRKAGFEKFLKHRTGHGIGLEGHESPWIAEGDKTVLREGMVFSCEPGVYDPEFGGFRHSDTVVVRKDKGEILNTYPTRLEEMVIEI